MGDSREPSDKRRDPRRPLVLQVAYRNRDDLARDFTENVSAGGLFIRTEQPFAIGDELALELSFPDLLEPFAIVAKVAWLRPATKDEPGGVGIRAVGEADRARMEELAHGPRASKSSYRILLVEDNPHTLEMYRYALDRLQRQGADGALEVRLARDGVEASAQLDAGGIDLVITDLYMPVLNGLALIERLRSHPKSCATPVLVISAADERVRKQAEQLGADAVLQKPVRFADLLETIRHLLALRPD